MIEKLTREQENQLVEYREYCLKRGLCTDPANRGLAENAINAFYKKLNKPKPYIWWCGSVWMFAFNFIVKEKDMKRINNQHGDVILKETLEIPKDAKRVKACNGFVIEKGEGVHTHVLKAAGCLTQKDFDASVEVWAINDTLLIKVKKEGVSIDHEEHKTQPLKKGIHEKVIEREFDYENEVERRVID